jgi:DNA damage-binding protein 1
MKPAEGEGTPIPTTIFGTVTGSIGVIASIPKEDYEYFDRVQKSINNVIKGVGGLSHSELVFNIFLKISCNY